MVEIFFFFSFGRGWFLVFGFLVSFGFLVGVMLMRSRRELWWFLLERR